jgi:hypothetical protein
MPIHFHIRTLMIAIAIMALPLALVAQGYVGLVLALGFLIVLIAMPILAADLTVKWGGAEGRPMTLVQMAVNLTGFAILVIHALLVLLGMAFLILVLTSFLTGSN